MHPQLRSEILRKALLSRRTEERLLELFSSGEVSGTLHTCIGQEFSGAAVCSQLREEDAVLSSHRGHGHYLSFTDDVDGIVAELMGKSSGCCGGLGGSQHLSRGNFYSSGVQGGIAPIALGHALARKRQGGGHISAVFLGDGTLGEGAVYESFNLAAKWELPLLFVLENNGIAQSTPLDDALAGDILPRAAAFDIRTERANTWDWEDLAGIARKSIDYVRKESKPLFLLVDTYRLKAHSKGDDTRPRTEVELFEKRDPLNILLADADPELQKLDAEAKARVELAVEKAKQSSPPEFRDGEPHKPKLSWHTLEPSSYPRGMRYGAALNRAFVKLMEKNEKVLFIGEDVLSPYGGAFKIAEGLSSAFPDRVLSTPISEAAITGLGIGLAVAGFRPFVEIMFGDFLTLAMDQLLNHAAKFEETYGRREMNLVVRTPMGGKRGYGPTHSQSLEKHFLGIPGLRVLAPSQLLDPQDFLHTLVAGHTGAALLIENKSLYSEDMPGGAPQGYEFRISNEPFPTLHVTPNSAIVNLSIVAYGGMVRDVLAVLKTLFYEHDLICQALIPSQLYPFEITDYREILDRSPATLFVEEGQSFASFSSECAASLASSGYGGRISRLHSAAASIPASPALEKRILPGTDAIIRKALELAGR